MTCPVCRADVNRYSRYPTVIKHRDGVGRWCGMSGKPFKWVTG